MNSQRQPLTVGLNINYSFYIMCWEGWRILKTFFQVSKCLFRCRIFFLYLFINYNFDKLQFIRSVQAELYPLDGEEDRCVFGNGRIRTSCCWTLWYDFHCALQKREVTSVQTLVFSLSRSFVASLKKSVGMPLSDRSSSDGGEPRSPRARRPRTRSRSRNRNDSRERSLSPDSFGPKLPKPRNKEREREERERRFREARNLRRIRIGSPRRSRSRSRSRSRERHNNNHWPEQRDAPGKHGSFKDDYYYEQQRDDAQRQRQEAFIARYQIKTEVLQAA